MSITGKRQATRIKKLGCIVMIIGALTFIISTVIFTVFKIIEMVGVRTVTFENIHYTDYSSMIGLKVALFGGIVAAVIGCIVKLQNSTREEVENGDK